MDIPHRLDGWVKDLAEANDVTVSEMYQRVIERGCEELDEN